MTLSNVKLILLREIRDQLRDRRTLFVIAVLPIVLYPLLGMSLLQVSQFMREQPTQVLIVGQAELADLPALFSDGRFADELFANPQGAKLLELHFNPPEAATAARLPSAERMQAYCQVQAGKYDAAVYFPPDFAAQLEAFRQTVGRRTQQLPSPGTDQSLVETAAGGEGGECDSQPTATSVRLEVPSPEIIYSTASDKSQIAFARLSDVLRRWTERIGEDNLARSGVPSFAARPFSVGSSDVADAARRAGSMWSKILPVLMLLWALTGAFYPAVDLCAGEKERGTLETLLCSPAERSEIVVGKLVTIMIFSMITAVLNLLSVGVTGWMVSDHLPGFGLPPVAAVLALSLALVPIAALFSALCLALAAFARSTKEGQYYLMPVLVITMPLVVLPMSPGVELNLGNSLIPVTGVVLLLRSVLEGDLWTAVRFSPAVAAVTITACALSIRWAVEQFNSESVLFRESERLDLRLWLRRLWIDRQATPTTAAAVFCGMVILLANFFQGFSAKMPTDFGEFAHTVLATQLGVILLPALLMTFLLTRSPRKTLLLRRSSIASIFAAVLLAVLLHPTANLLQIAVQYLYPVSESMRPALERMQTMFRQTDFWPLVLLIAVVPAVCEELAFRGYILSGFRRMRSQWRAIVYSAVFFALAHGVLQQSLIACLLGMLLGFLAVQSRSILPGMAFHAVHNALAMANGRISSQIVIDFPWLKDLVVPADGGGCMFTWQVIVVGLLGACLVLAWFGRMDLGQGPAEPFQREPAPLPAQSC